MLKKFQYFIFTSIFFLSSLSFGLIAIFSTANDLVLPKDNTNGIISNILVNDTIVSIHLLNDEIPYTSKLTASNNKRQSLESILKGDSISLLVYSHRIHEIKSNNKVILSRWDVFYSQLEFYITFLFISAICGFMFFKFLEACKSMR